MAAIPKERRTDRLAKGLNALAESRSKEEKMIVVNSSKDNDLLQVFVMWILLRTCCTRRNHLLFNEWKCFLC